MAVLMDIPGRDLDLMPAETLMRSHPEELRGIVKLGDPDVFDAVEYAAEGGTDLEPGARLLLSSNVFSLVRLPLSVRPRGEAQVRFLAIECELHSDSGAGSSQSVCWSIAPERIEDEVTATTGGTLSAGLTVGVATVSAEASRQQEVVIYQPRITAFGLGAPELAWEVEPTRGRDVRGVQILHFVVKAPKGARTECSVRIRLDVSIRRLLWNTVAVADDGSEEVARFVASV